MYTVTATLTVDGVTTQTESWWTGFRTATFSADNGLTINGEKVNFRGFSHHDSFVGCGVAMPPRIDLFRAQAGRAVGANVWRMSHNPYHPPLYDILDALGTTVWDENRDLGP
jgi:beta-galactosidase/beta-glucuronidase